MKFSLVRFNMLFHTTIDSQLTHVQYDTLSMYTSRNCEKQANTSYGFRSMYYRYYSKRLLKCYSYDKRMDDNFPVTRTHIRIMYVNIHLKLIFFLSYNYIILVYTCFDKVLMNISNYWNVPETTDNEIIICLYESIKRRIHYITNRTAMVLYLLNIHWILKKKTLKTPIRYTEKH